MSALHSSAELPMYRSKTNPRKDYRQQESQRVAGSATLAETFRDLKSLTCYLAHFSPESFVRKSEIKYTANLANEKSRLRFSCPNQECVGGDFDLSAALAAAVEAHRPILTGELICDGWHSKEEIGKRRCRHILRYRLTADYLNDGVPAENEEAVVNPGSGDC